MNAVVVAVWQFPLGFGAQAAAGSGAHLAVLAAGCCLLARERRLPVALACMVGVVGALNGWEIGWGATDWFGALAAHAWLPWAWWAFEVAMRPSPGQIASRDRLRSLLPAPFVYLVLTGGFPYSVVMLVLISAWLAIRALAERRAAALGPLISGWIFGLGLSAPAWLSLLAGIRGSQRAEGVGPGNHAWTVPLSSLPGAILPNWSTHWRNFSDAPTLHAALEWTGAFVPLVGLLAGIVCLRKRLLRACGWDLSLLGVVLLLCLLPSPGLFRWSFRWLPLLHIVLALVGARAWAELSGVRGKAVRAGPVSFRSWPFLRTSGGSWATAAVALTWLAMAVAGAANPDPLTRDCPAWLLGCSLAWLALEIGLPRRALRQPWLPAAAALVSLWVTYRHLPTNPGVPKYAFGASLSEADPLSTDRLYLALYPEPEHADVAGIARPARAEVLRPGSTNLFAGLRFVNGYTPIMGPGIGRELRMKTHGEIPPEVGRGLFDPGSGFDRKLLEIGVDGLIVARNYPAEVRPPAGEWTVVFSSPHGTVYHRRGDPLPPVVDLGAMESPPPVIENSRLQVVVDVSSVTGQFRPVLNFRRPYFPGYEASLDGAPLPVGAQDGLTPAVQLPPGRHRRLVLRYRPRAVVWGAEVAGLALVAWLCAAVSLYRAGRRCRAAALTTD